MAALVIVLAVGVWLVMGSTADARLIRAIRSGDSTTVSAMIDAGADVNRQTSIPLADNFSGWTPLAWAAFERDPESLSVLLEAGADPDIADRHGFAPLHLVFRSWKPGPTSACVRILLDGGADPNAGSEYSRPTPLQLAVLNGDDDDVQMLIDSGADPNTVDSSGVCPLYEAIFMRQDPAIVRALLRAGATPSLRTPSGKTIRELVAERGTNEMRDVLREHEDRL